jgi:hypothetical protein
MIDIEPVIHDELERLAPEAEVELPDWQDVIRRANRTPADGYVIEANPIARRRRWTRSLAVAVALAGTVAALALVSPWDSGPTLVDRALAAVGDEPVLHAVIARPPRLGERLIDVGSGVTIERLETTEIWFDRSRDLKKTVTALDGRVLDEMLETASGGFTRGGPVYTCAWIAAHPVEATKAGVSCNPSGENGTTPRQIPEQPPTLDEALAGFVDRYQSGLASGRVRAVGRGQLDGREVIWLELPSGETRTGVVKDRVAIDADTYKPLLVEAASGAVRFRVLEIETVPFAPSLFTRPELVKDVPGGVGGSVTAKTAISPSRASAALGKPALWLGEEWRGYRLIETNRADLSIGYGPRSERQPTQTIGVEFEYAKLAADGSLDRDSTFTLRETTICTIHWGWRCGPPKPPPGTMLTGVPPGALIRTEDLYISVWDLAGRLEAPSLELARALRPVTNG